MTTNGNETPEQHQPPGGQPAAGPFGIPARWLLIGGGGGGGVLVIVIVVVLLFVTGVIGGGNPQPTSILDLVPDDAEVVTRMDVDRILGNDLLADEIFDADDWEELEDGLSIDPEDLSEMIIAAWGGGEIVVIAGNFDLDYIREELEDQDNEENSYRGYEVWEDPDGSAGALLEGYIVFSESTRPVENVLKNLYNGEGFIAQASESNEMKQVLDKLPNGFVKFAQVGDNCRVERCEGYGWVMTEVDEDDEEATVEIALLFRNERGAERAADDYDGVAEFLEQEGLDIQDTEADGVFVTGEAIQDLEERSSAPSPAAPAGPSSPAAAATATPYRYAAPAVQQQAVQQQRAAAPAGSYREEFLNECRQEMTSELGRGGARSFCQCSWEGLVDVGISERNLLTTIEEYVEGQNPRVDTVIESCLLAALGG